MAALPPHLIARLARAALLEDLGPGDLTSTVLAGPQVRARGTIAAGQELVVAGLEPASAAFRILDPAVSLTVRAVTGAVVGPGESILEVTGLAGAILSAERTALNFIGWLSGVATMTRRCVRAVEGTGASIYDTRKTTPGLRLLERHAVTAGGGRNHRFGLFDAVLIKDNHLILTEGVGAAVLACRERLGPEASIEVEVEDMAGLEDAIRAGADIVLLDNMPPDSLSAAVERAGACARETGRPRPALEASGGITLGTIRQIALTGVDRISLGSLTHSAPAADVGLTLSHLAT